MIKVAVNGANGRMGRLISQLVEKEFNMELVGVIEREGSDLIGKPYNEKLNFVSSLEDVESKPDVVIDFTVPEVTLALIETAVKESIAVVTGTTGFTTSQTENLRNFSKDIPLLFSPNMSLGVNVLFKVVEQVAKALEDKDYDIEIFEIHHRFKKDAPSGTAMKLAEILAKTLKRDPEKDFVFGRKGFVGQRKAEEIGVLASRMGDVVGDHTVYFATLGERVELTHRATSRETFAKGAVVAAKWLYGKSAGFYNMFDVLGLN